MKWVLIGLIIANIGVAIWGTLIRDKETGELFVENNLEKIKLIQETRPEMIKIAEKKRKIEEILATPADRSAAKGKAVNKGLPAQDSRTAVCWKIAYFETQQQAKQAQKKLFEQSIAATIKLDPKADKITGYNVIILPHKSLKKAKKKQQALIDAGFNDLWLYRSGPLKYGISLGIFKTKKAADDFSEQANEKEFKTEVQEKYEKAKLYYLEFMGSESDTISLTPLKSLLSEHQMPLIKDFCE